ncbi:BirA family transcriptional regulator, biotin operon repressor / biotin-[acetyl-CoA-carboxylase] ligase [Flavobacteriaceae bacterium MAR_2010_188]|nr:BirA family transcriptional regulator, biotin operon repressor / biotin-[acetyl-CoA-carboxylase] ligase [Flavobacteriaceae bacterium MAR_2010_188]
MRIIKLNAIDSTNSYLRKLCANGDLSDFTIVTANIQNNGRGQMGTTWVSEKGKNLTASIYKRFNYLEIEDKFLISMLVSVSVMEALRALNIRNLNIKWPNDILAESQKIGGILIENIIKGDKIDGSIIGIGLNVQQTNFENLPRATSLLCLSGKTYETEEVLYTIIDSLKRNCEELKAGNGDYIKNTYHQYLFRRDKPSTFKDEAGNLFSGYIKGVSDNGNMVVILEDEIEKHYDLKEVTLLY